LTNSGLTETNNNKSRFDEEIFSYRNKEQRKFDEFGQITATQLFEKFRNSANLADPTLMQKLLHIGGRVGVAAKQVVINLPVPQYFYCKEKL
jgi:hypothetical protein